MEYFLVATNEASGKNKRKNGAPNNNPEKLNDTSWDVFETFRSEKFIN